MLSLLIWDNQNEKKSRHKLFWAKYNCKPQGKAFWWRLEFWGTGLRTEFRYSILKKKKTRKALIKTQWNNHKIHFISGASFYIFRHQDGSFHVKGTLVDVVCLFRLIMQHVVEVLFCVYEKASLYYFSAVYFSTLSVSLRTRCPKFGKFKNEELKRIWMAAMTFQLRYCMHFEISLAFYSLFQWEFSRQRDLVLLCLKSSNFSFPYSHPVSAYVFFLVFSFFLSFLQ